jgi:hypothetical protein
MIWSCLLNEKILNLDQMRLVYFTNFRAFKQGITGTRRHTHTDRISAFLHSLLPMLYQHN